VNTQGSSRYLHIIVAMILPALGLAADASIHRWRALAVVVPVLFLIGLPGNIRATGRQFENQGFYSGYAEMVRSLPRMDLAQRVPRGLNPDPVNGPGISVGWLLDGARSGQIPAPSTPPPPKLLAEYQLRLTLQQSNGGEPTSCTHAPRRPTPVHLVEGQSFAVFGGVQISLLENEPGTTSIPVPFGRSFASGIGPHTVRDVGGPVTVNISASYPYTMVCGLQSPP
jgi:hypothetical protein